MKTLGNLAVIFLVILGLLALIPLISLGVAILGTVMVIAI